MRGRLEPGTNRINLFTVGRVTEGLARLIDENGEEAKKRGVAISIFLIHVITQENLLSMLLVF